MPLSTRDISALKSLFQSLFREEIQPFREEFQQFHREVNSSFDALFKRDEKREQKYLAIHEQVGRLEKRIAGIRS
jgi:hypothetical protein